MHAELLVHAFVTSRNGLLAGAPKADDGQVATGHQLRSTYRQQHAEV